MALRPVRRLRSAIEVSGALSEDAVWDADTVRVVGPVTVEDEVTLTVAPGARVEFADFYDLTVLGRILAVGTPEEPIVFTTDEPEAFAADSSTAGCWNGVRFPWTPSSNAESRLEHCVLEYSKALGAQPFGGALSVTGFSKLIVRNCVFRENAAGYGGAVACSHHAAPVLVGNLFERNVAFLRGSVLYALYAYPHVTSSTVAENAVLNDEPFDATGAIHNHISKTRTIGSIIWNNTSAYYVQAQLLEAKAYYTRFCDIEGGHPGEGNIDQDPLFVGLGGDPYALSPGSPCIDAGPPDTLGLRLPETDLAGLPRVVGERLDAGGYEGAAGAGVADEGHESDPGLSLWPNPFGLQTTLSFVVPAGAHATSVLVFDVTGRLVRSLAEGDLSAGPHEIVWDGADGAGRRVAAGVYVAVVASGTGRRALAKVVLLR